MVVRVLAAGIGPLAIGPVLGMGRSVTGAGLALFAVGYLLYVHNLVRTSRAGSPSAFAQWVLIAQAWILGPAGLAPFILFGVPLGIPERWMETGALHFFFTGWALPVALALLALDFRNLAWVGRTDPERSHSVDVVPYQTIPDTVVRGWMIWTWNIAVLGVGVAFFYQDTAWSPGALAVGFTALVALWGRHLARITQQRRRFRTLRAATPLAR